MREPRNVHDQYAVDEKKSGTVVGPFTTMFGKSVVALFAMRGYDYLTLPVRLPVLTTLLAFIAHHLLHFLVTPVRACAKQG